MLPDEHIQSPVARSATFLVLIFLISLALTVKATDQRGEFGADLRFLSSFWKPAQTPGESNYFVDMWEAQNLRAILASNGLTNNHTLFVNCHGKRISNGRFAFYPHQSLVKAGSLIPYYSVGDLATLVGCDRLPDIHNLVLAACNAEGALSTRELRQFFPHATNIVHCMEGELGYQPMFLQAIINYSWTVKPVYEWSERNEKGELQYVTGHNPVHGAKRLAPYTAELFCPGVDKPFRVQRAGREILD